MNEKRRTTQRKLQLLGLVIILTGLLGLSPAKAFNEAPSTSNPDIEARAPAAAQIVVKGGGQSAILNALKKAKPGDTILVKSGNYDNNNPLEPLKINVTGTASAPITLLGENRPKLGTLVISSARYFILDGFEIANQSSSQLFNGINIKSSKNIIVRNMLIHHLTATGINLAADSSDVVIENSKIYELVPRRTGTGSHCIYNTTAKNLTIRNNECHDYIGDGFQAGRGDETILYNRGVTLIEGNIFYNSPQKAPCAENAIDIKAESGQVIIRGNVMYGFQPLTGQGCQLQASGDPAGSAITAHEDSNGILLIEANEFYNMYNAVSNNDMNTTIRNNVFHDFKEGVFLWSTNKHLGAIIANKNSKIYHNTFVNVPFLFSENAPGSQQVINNIFYNITGNKKYGTNAGTYRANNWYKVHASQQVSGSGDIQGDPNLDFNTSNNILDYSLIVNSQLINRGQANLNIATDFTETPNIRLVNNPPDIGAFEYNAAAVPISTAAENPAFADIEFTSASLDLTSILTDTPEPPGDSALLILNGPASLAPGQSTSVSVQGQGLSGAGLYGVQLEINYEPELISVSNVQLNPDLLFVVQNTVDDASGKIKLAASRQGNVPGLTGDVTLLTFDVAAKGASGMAVFNFENVKVGDSQANALEVIPQNYTLEISEAEEPTPEPTVEPTVEPTDEPTPQPTDEPTPTPTYEPTPLPTGQPTPQPTDAPTSIPTDEPAPQPTETPTPEATDEPTPVPTGQPGGASLSGQVILTGRSDSNWSDAVVVLDDSGQPSGQLSAVTDPTGFFNLANVTIGAHTAITADAAGYLPAVCNAPLVNQGENNLTPITLLSGDINDDNLVDVTDATTVGVKFGVSEPGSSADINHDDVIDIFDIILVSVNFGQGPQVWDCLAK